MEKVKRKLASIQIVREITPIKGADRIEVAHVLGWQCVVNKGDFKPGDKCIYMEVDSFLPICDQLEFLRKSSYKKSDLLGEGFRLKTITLRGHISQGLVQKLDILPDGEYNVGDDVTDILGIKKWEVEERATNVGTAIADFPGDISKTDELRVQSFPELHEELKAVNGYYITTKMDGTSFTMYLRNDHFGVCSRNNEYADDGKCDMWEYAHKRNIEENVRKNGFTDIVIQGEFCAPGIQKNRLRLQKPEWYVFTIVENNKRVGWERMKEICSMLGLDTVPLEETGETLPYNSIDELIERAKGKYASGNNKEGIVIRPLIPVRSQATGKYLSMKVLNNDFLLKE